jgi:hypothetical protein
LAIVYFSQLDLCVIIPTQYLAILTIPSFASFKNFSAIPCWTMSTSIWDLSLIRSVSHNSWTIYGPYSHWLSRSNLTALHWTPFNVNITNWPNRCWHQRGFYMPSCFFQSDKLQQIIIFFCLFLRYNCRDWWLCEWLQTPQEDSIPRILILDAPKYAYSSSTLLHLIRHIKKV